jgi:hypothetical protein
VDISYGFQGVFSPWSDVFIMGYNISDGSLVWNTTLRINDPNVLGGARGLFLRTSDYVGSQAFTRFIYIDGLTGRIVVDKSEPNNFDLSVDVVNGCSDELRFADRRDPCDVDNVPIAFTSEDNSIVKFLDVNSGNYSAVAVFPITGISYWQCQAAVLSPTKEYAVLLGEVTSDSKLLYVVPVVADHVSVPNTTVATSTQGPSVSVVSTNTATASPVPQSASTTVAGTYSASSLSTASPAPSIDVTYYTTPSPLPTLSVSASCNRASIIPRVYSYVLSRCCLPLLLTFY